jgi:regulator of cell morphogenesis and NO signaling
MNGGKLRANRLFQGESHGGGHGLKLAVQSTSLTAKEYHEPMDTVRVSEFFQHDHDRLDDLFKNFQKYQVLDYPRAREYFAQFAFGWNRHMVWEEQVLFPVFKRKAGAAASGPIRVMKLEHQQIAEYLENIDQKVKAGSGNSGEEETKLLAVLALHSQNEENILFPSIDKTLNHEEIEALFKAIRSVPDESTVRFCHHGA